MQEKVKVDRDELIALLEAVLDNDSDRFLRARQVQYSLFHPILKNCPPDAEYYTSGEIEFLEKELEILRQENASLKLHKEYDQTLDQLITERDVLLTEREQWMKQDHALKVCEQHLECYRKVVRGPLPQQQQMLDVRSSFYDWALSKGLSIDSVWSSHGEPFKDEDTQTCWEIWQAAQSAAHPLPAQQVPEQVIRILERIAGNWSLDYRADAEEVLSLLSNKTQK